MRYYVEMYLHKHKKALHTFKGKIKSKLFDYKAVGEYDVLHCKSIGFTTQKRPFYSAKG